MKLPWSLQLLGGLQATSADNHVVRHFRTQKTGALLAYLAISPKSHSRETLLARFWPDDDEMSARQSLRVALAFLRRTLEPPGTSPGTVLSADRLMVRLVPGAVECDACLWEAAVRRAAHLSHNAPPQNGPQNTGACIEAWEIALGLYSGVFLPAYYDDWILAERERLHDLWCDAHLRFAALCETSGDWRRGIAVLDALQAGRSDGIGEEPPEASVLRKRLCARKTAAPPKAAFLSAAQRFLPLDSFCGRTAEIAALRDLARDPAVRFITLTGPGGTGKTRLVLQAADALSGAHQSENSPLPVYVAPLASIWEAKRLPEVLADAVGLPRAKSATSEEILQSVIFRLNDGPPALLVLDNLEQIAGHEAAQILRTLLGGASHLTCFATSRRRVGVIGERLFTVAPLPPNDAVRLFCDRAQAACGDFDEGADRDDIAALCGDLEGLPLAVELAAAWSAVLSPREMREKLQGRFALLATRKSDKTDRHRSLWAAISWSYDLLPRDLRQTWNALSVFRGGFTREAAGVVAGNEDDDTTEALARLCERSLLVRRQGRDKSLRFEMLPSLQDFAQEQLSRTEQTAARKKHAAHFFGFTTDGYAKLYSEEQGAFMCKWHDEMPNLRHALGYHGETVGEASAEEYLRFAARFGGVCRSSGYLRDARETIQTALSRTDTNALLKLPTVQKARTSAENMAGLTAWMQGDTTEAEAHFNTVLAFWRTQNDGRGVGSVLGNLALLAMEAEDYQKAWDLCAESLPLLRQHNDLRAIANSVTVMGNARLEQKRWADALTHHEEGLRLYREIGDRDGESIALASMGYAAQFAGDFSAAAAYYKESLQIRRDLQDTWRICFSLGSIADLLWAQQNALPALTLYAAAEVLRQSINAPLSHPRQKTWDEQKADMRKFAGGKAARAEAKGAAMDGAAAVGFALAVCSGIGLLGVVSGI